jgi:hypothetical protein
MILCGIASETSQPLINLKAFHILLVNPFPWLHNSHRMISFPAEALNNNPTRTPSAPNFQLNPMGLVSSPNFDILRLSRTNPVKYTFVNGFYRYIHNLL